MKFTTEDVGRRVYYKDAAHEHRPIKYGSIRDVVLAGTRQMIDFAADDSKRNHQYIWSDDCEFLPEDHPEY